MVKALSKAGLWMGRGVLGLALPAGCGAPAYRIGFAQGSTHGPWRRAMLAGMERELSFHPEGQLRMLDAYDNSAACTGSPFGAKTRWAPSSSTRPTC